MTSQSGRVNSRNSVPVIGRPNANCSAESAELAQTISDNMAQRAARGVPVSGRTKAGKSEYRSAVTPSKRPDIAPRRISCRSRNSILRRSSFGVAKSNASGKS